MIFFGFTIAVHGKSTDKISIFTFCFKRTAGFQRNIACVSLVHNVFYGDRKVIPGGLIDCVDIIVDSNKTYTISRKNTSHITAGFNILTSKSGKILYNHTVDLSLHNIIHHFFESRAIKNHTTITVVHSFRNKFDLWVVAGKFLNQLSLVSNTVTFV